MLSDSMTPATTCNIRRIIYLYKDTNLSTVLKVSNLLYIFYLGFGNNFRKKYLYIFKEVTLSTKP